MIEEKTEGRCSTFRDFYFHYHQYVRTILFRFGINSDLEDLVQKTFIKAWQKLIDFEKKSSIKTWLTRIAINMAKDYLRQNQRHPIEIEPNFAAPPDQDQAENRQLIQLAISSLNWDQRVIVVLCLMEGYSLEEAAEMTKIPIGTAKSRLTRARSTMKQTLLNLGAKL